MPPAWYEHSIAGTLISRVGVGQTVHWGGRPLIRIFLPSRWSPGRGSRLLSPVGPTHNGGGESTTRLPPPTRPPHQPGPLPGLTMPWISSLGTGSGSLASLQPPGQLLRRSELLPGLPEGGAASADVGAGTGPPSAVRRRGPPRRGIPAAAAERGIPATTGAEEGNPHGGCGEGIPREDRRLGAMGSGRAGTLSAV